MKKFLPILFLLILLGCETISIQKEEISKEKIKDIEESIIFLTENFDTRIKKLENNQEEILKVIDKIGIEISETLKNLNENLSKDRDYSEDIKKLRQDIATLKQELRNSSNRINEVKGKIDEVIVSSKNDIRQTEENFNRKIMDIDKDIKEIKKNYSDILGLPLTIQKSISEFQTIFQKTTGVLQENFINLKDYQLKLARNLDEIDSKINELKEKYENLENKVNIQNKTLIEEITRHESEIYGLKKEITYLTRDLKEIYEINYKKINEIVENLDIVQKTYANLIGTASTLTKSLSSFNDEIMNLKNTNFKLNQEIEKINKILIEFNDDIKKTKEKFNENNKIYIDEFIKLEKEIQKIKEILYAETDIIPFDKEKIKFLDFEKTEEVYIVQKGDFLSKIAEKYKVSVEEIKKANNLKSDIIYPGQKLIIPKKPNILPKGVE